MEKESDIGARKFGTNPLGQTSAWNIEKIQWACFYIKPKLREIKRCHWRKTNAGHGETQGHAHQRNGRGGKKGPPTDAAPHPDKGPANKRI